MWWDASTLIRVVEALDGLQPSSTKHQFLKDGVDFVPAVGLAASTASFENNGPGIPRTMSVITFDAYNALQAEVDQLRAEIQVLRRHEDELAQLPQPRECSGCADRIADIAAQDKVAANLRARIAHLESLLARRPPSPTTPVQDTAEIKAAHDRIQELEKQLALERAQYAELDQVVQLLRADLDALRHEARQAPRTDADHYEAEQMHRHQEHELAMARKLISELEEQLASQQATTILLQRRVLELEDQHKDQENLQLRANLERAQSQVRVLQATVDQVLASATPIATPAFERPTTPLRTSLHPAISYPNLRSVASPRLVLSQSPSFAQPYSPSTHLLDSDGQRIEDKLKQLQIQKEALQAEYSRLPLSSPHSSKLRQETIEATLDALDREISRLRNLVE